MLIKVCGMRDAGNINKVESLGVDMIGLIFYSGSSRYVACPPSYLPEKAKKVGVFVNETEEVVLALADKFSLNFIQLHGTESPEYCVSLRNKGLNLIKVFSVATPEDLKATEKYEGLCSYFLFDTKCEGHGGSGKQFDWSVLSHYHGQTPFLLSGGISAQSVEDVKTFKHERFAGIDLNSRFEISRALKDVEMLSRFIKELRK